MTAAPANDDFDPLTVPVRPAATVMLLDDRPDLQVLMLRRTAKLVFAPDNWVFPGGRVDPGDHIDDFDQLCVGLSDASASEIIGVERGGLAWWLAACRETLEEAGLLLAAGDLPASVDVAGLRDQVRADENVFVDLLLEHDLAVDVTAIEQVGRFVTPVGSPRRFDAHFFVAKAPIDQEAAHDDGEIVHLDWMAPADALERWQRGELTMMTPTVRMLACLDRFGTAEEVMTMARKRLPYNRVKVADPDGDYRVVLPGEDGYETAELEVESGWIRLWGG
ncbi:MAG: NUDIX domain-containing protein [Actinomycetota bacterium]